MRANEVEHVNAVLTALRAATFPVSARGSDAGGPHEPPRFVTISRQAGAGGKIFGTELVDTLNRLDPGPQPWTVWDHELVERVSSEHHIPKDLIESIEDVDHPWLCEFVESLSTARDEGEFKVYRRVALTIRALAQAGRAVIVGRGGAFITAGMPGAVNVRLVAPLDYRVRRMAERLQIAPEQAALRVHEIDRNREAFYRRHWPGKRVAPETFTVTLNTAELTDPQMVACLVPLVTDGSGQGQALSKHQRPPRTVSPFAQRTGTVHGGAL